MLKVTILAIILMCSFNSIAQTKKPSSLTITTGPSFPLGDFKRKDLSIEAGQANMGGFLDIGYRKMYSTFGAIALLRGKIHGVDLSNLQGPTGSTMRTESTVWKSVALMVGLYREISLTKNENFNFELNGLVGAQRTTSPEVNISISGFGENLRNEQKPMSSTAFTYLLGTAFKYKFSQSVALKFSADFNESKPEYTVITDRDHHTGEFIKTANKQSTATFNLGLGLVISL